MTFAFGTKAETLDRLRSHLQIAAFCEQLTFTVAEWNDRPDTIVQDICARFASQTLAIRSSARDEDGWASSKAGAYRSMVRVAADPDSVFNAVRLVIESYGSNEVDHQILVQPMVENVVISGVILSRDLDTLSPYYAINYDDFSGRTDTVTGGVVNKAMLVLRNRSQALRSPRFRRLVELVRQVEDATGCDELDIEFCITDRDEVVVLQVRPLTMVSGAPQNGKGGLEEALDSAHARLEAAMRPLPGMLGVTTVFGEMPDWNPAEMIGSAPRPLALSLYKHLITDDIWRQSRERMGYCPVGAVPLMVDFGGRPFIDVRASLNSFLPRGIDEVLGARLVNWQIERLLTHPEFHDKVEFEIATTCRAFDFEDRVKPLQQAGFSGRELASLEELLAALTRAAVEDHRRTHRALQDAVSELARRRQAASSAPAIMRVRRLLNDCRDYGTLPFADLARHAFIGISFLKSLISRGALSEDDGDRFLRGIHTVAGDLVRDMHDLAAGKRSMRDFLAAYGHLRPGTYDILSWRYDERPELYLGHGDVPGIEKQAFELSSVQREAIAALIEEAGYHFMPEELLAYIASSVRLREWAKFHFSHSISDALSALSQWGEAEGLSRDDLSYLEIGNVLSGNGYGDIGASLKEVRERHRITRAMRLPHLITSPDDVYVVRLPLGQPNFITHKRVIAPAIVLRSGEFPPIDKAIVVTESADPGFDWIFSHHIAGLVTKFGGANSHMAIRCAEFGLPAAIGCGERAFSALAKAKLIELDAGHRTVRAIR